MSAATTPDWQPSWLCIIPARGGSAGVPRKNLRTVDGIPLVARAVNAARQVPEFQDVVVSTDDPEIAAVAELAGATVLVRPDYLSGPEVVVSDVVSHVVATWPHKVEGYAVMQSSSS